LEKFSKDVPFIDFEARAAYLMNDLSVVIEMRTDTPGFAAIKKRILDDAAAKGLNIRVTDIIQISAVYLLDATPEQLEGIYNVLAETRKNPYGVKVRVRSLYQAKIAYKNREVVALNKEIKLGAPRNPAQISDPVGGIDLNPDMLALKTSGKKSVHVNNAAVVDLEKALGLSPVVMRMTPVTDLTGFFMSARQE
jgi:hypothetical protein